MTVAARIERRLRALSPRERLLLILCASSIGIVLLVRLFVYPVIGAYRRTRAEIPLRRATLERYESIRNQQDGTAGMLAEAMDRLKKREEGLLPGDDPSASGAILQGILKPRVGGPETRLTSTRTLSPVSKGGYAEVAVQMDLQTTTDGLARILAEIARDPRILRVRKLTVTSGIYSAAMAARPDSLTVSVVVAGMAESREEIRPGGGGRE